MGEDRSTFIIIVSVVVVIGLLVAWVFVSNPEQAATFPVTEVRDPAAIQSSVQLSHLSIATSENFARQKIYVISAYLKNISDKPLRAAEVKMTFTDFDGKPIRDYTRKIIEPTQKPVAPGVEFRFEVRQENLPRGWNYRIPVTEITKIGH
jgi:capsule polysaccharide export protein KpsE/RkpR